MTHEANDEISDTILQAEENILRIAEELRRMKTAAELLDEAGKRSLLLQEAVENLVFEIGTLVELSGRVIETLDASEVRGLVTQMRTVLSRRMDGLRTELLENTRATVEQAGAELQTVLVQQIDSLGTEITAGTRSVTEQVKSEVVTANEQSMAANDAILKRLDALSFQVAEVRDLAEASVRRRDGS
ncbi:MAG: hypothetical protein OXG26_10860 [Caldilineaceae bacterium]|nr:hypothetical protein [Caldilineaceae bacterium]